MKPEIFVTGNLLMMGWSDLPRHRPTSLHQVVIIAVGAGSATQESKNLQTETHVSDLRQVAWTAAH
jgi:hypothetical protein